MCHQSSDPCVTAEEPVPAEESLLVYCKPIELYNILQRRTIRNPSFLTRCLDYKIEAKWKAGLMDGNVLFNYRDQNNLLRKNEVTRQFSCPFCLMRCGSFKGLRCHLITSHDLFKFEFWVTEEYKAVNVSVKTDALNSEISACETEPQLQQFCLCSKPRKRKKPEDPLEKGKYVYPHVLEPVVATESHLECNGGDRIPSSCPLELGQGTNSKILRESHGPYENGTNYGAANAGVPVARAQTVDDMDCVQSMCVDKAVPTTVHPNAKSRKLFFERLEPKSSTFLQKRQFYHSHRAQPMAMDQVLSDRDSEDEIDDDIADLEDRRMLDDFVDVIKDEKHLMHLWNSFVRKQRVLADGHIPWACGAFLQLHGQKLAQSQALFWCWRLFMIKLWNHGLLDACSMNDCSMILQKHQAESLADRKCLNTCKTEP